MFKKLSLNKVVLAIALASVYSETFAQVDATGEVVVRSTLRKSEKGDLSGGGASSIADFLTKNAGKEYRLFQLKNKYGTIYAEIRINFEPERIFIRSYYSAGNGSGPLLPHPYHYCEVTAIKSSAGCGVSTGHSGYTVYAEGFKVTPYDFRFVGGDYYAGACDYCSDSRTARNYYITQDRLNQGLGFEAE